LQIQEKRDILTLLLRADNVIASFLEGCVMYCRNCGTDIGNSAFCHKCGVPNGVGTLFCPTCGAAAQPDGTFCKMCGTEIGNSNAAKRYYSTGAAEQRRSKLVAGLLGIFLGSLGIHNFYLGYNKKGIVQICITFLSLGILSPVSALWGLIEAILIFTGSINEDAQGIPLKE